MKVRYKIHYIDEYGQDFPCGCIAEHSEGEAKKRIGLGVCMETDKDAYSRKLPPSAPVSFECAVPFSNIALNIAMSEQNNEGTKKAKA